MLVCIDPGHAKSTAGKRSPDNSFFEYEFNRDVAKRIKVLLEAKGVETIYTVDLEDARDLDTYSRAAVANRANADFYISVHANAAGNGSEWENGRGIESYVYKFGGETANIGQTIHKNIMEVCKLKDRGLKAYGYDVLVKTNMPAILLELGFYDNKEECELLKADEYRQKCAEGTVKGICEAFNINYNEEVENAKKYIQMKTSFANDTMNWLSTYKYAEEMFIKLARAIEKGNK